MTFSKLFFYFCLFFLVGVFLASFLIVEIYFYLLILVLSLAVFILFYKKEASVFAICFLVLLLGVFWEERFEADIIPDCPAAVFLVSVEQEKEVCDIHYFNDTDEIVFQGMVLGEPSRGTRNTKLIINSQKAEINNRELSLRGRVLVFTPSFSQYQYGDELKIKGKINSPQEFPDFNYKEFLRKDRIYSVVFNSEIEIISRDNGNPFLKVIFALKERLKKTSKIMSLPEGSILAAMTLGDKAGISQDFKEKLSRAGLSHIIAISGMHIMILFGISLLLFFRIGLWRRQATLLTILLLMFYILMIGMPPSAVRAGIMGGLLYASYSFGRINQSARAIVFAAAGMVVVNPLILTRDVGFQLSFLASLGIIYLLPIFAKWIKAEGSKMKELISLTFAAQVFCFPILVFNFGQFPILSPISNLLVVPLLPLLLGIGFIFLVLGTIIPALAFPFSVIFQFPFTFVVKVVDLISSISFSSISFNIHWGVILIFYIALGWFLFGRNRFKKTKKSDE